jgi:hypothetical protein
VVVEEKIEEEEMWKKLKWFYRYYRNWDPWIWCWCSRRRCRCNKYLETNLSARQIPMYWSDYKWYRKYIERSCFRKTIQPVHCWRAKCYYDWGVLVYARSSVYHTLSYHDKALEQAAFTADKCIWCDSFE